MVRPGCRWPPEWSPPPGRAGRGRRRGPARGRRCARPTGAPTPRSTGRHRDVAPRPRPGGGRRTPRRRRSARRAVDRCGARRTPRPPPSPRRWGGRPGRGHRPVETCVAAHRACLNAPTPAPLTDIDASTADPGCVGPVLDGRRAQRKKAAHALVHELLAQGHSRLAIFTLLHRELLAENASVTYQTVRAYIASSTVRARITRSRGAFRARARRRMTAGSSSSLPGRSCNASAQHPPRAPQPAHIRSEK